MSLVRKHLAASALVLLAACASDTTGPGQRYDLPPIQPKFVLPPGTTPASFGLVIDTVRVQISQYDTTSCDCAVAGFKGARTPAQFASMIDTTYLDTLVPWPASKESFSFQYEVPPPDPGFGIEVYLQFYSGPTSLFYGYADLTFERGDLRLPPINMNYNGPGYNSDDIQVLPGDTAMAAGDSLQFSATAYNNATPLDTAYISWRVSDSAVARIDHTGKLKLRSGALGSSFLVLASIPNGVTTISRVSVPNTVAQLQKVSGDSQSAALGERTSAPLVVRARAADGKPVAGAYIRFAPVGNAAAFPDSLVLTDQFGLARSAPIPDSITAGAVKATVVGTALVANFTVTGTGPLTRALLFTSDSINTGWQLWRADSVGGTKVVLGYLSGTSASVAAPRWNPARNRVAYINYNANSALFDLILTTKNGDTTATLVSDANASEPRFSPNGQQIAWICNGFVEPPSANAGVCTYNGANGSLLSLGGAGNGGGKHVVTDAVPSRPTGTPGFAWRPGGLGRIAFSRDTTVDAGYPVTASRIYETNGDGSGLLPLSPRVADVGGGPIRIQGTMDWSPDGTTIVFSGSDTTNCGAAALFLLDVNTGAVRKLTTPPNCWQGDLYPKFSPDGQRILFQRVYYYYSAYYMTTDFYVARTAGGAPTRITYHGGSWGNSFFVPYYLGGDWSPNGASVVVVAPNGAGPRGAYRVPIDVTSQADYLARRVLVGNGAAGGNEDYGVSWQP